jgi:hypothetical protein
MDENREKGAIDQKDGGGPNVEAPAPPGTPPTPALVTREQLARVIGKHSRTIRRWERTRLAPALTVGEDGVHRFDVARVRELVELHERSTPVTPDSFDDGDTTAAVFELFAQGIEPVEVVVRMKLPAFAVEDLRRRWAALRGGYVVDRDIAREICAVRGATILNRNELLKNLRETFPPSCDGCNADLGWVDDSRAAAFCGTCATKLTAQRAAEAAAEAAAEQTRRRRQKEEQRQLAEYEKATREGEAEFYRTLRAMREGQGKK